MTKKLMLLALSAAALVAFAVPATASADHYKDNGGAIPGGHIVESWAGTAQFTTHVPGLPEQVGVHCSVTAEVTIETESAQVISFVGGGCVGLDGFSGCTVETGGNAGVAVGLETPWAINTAGGGNLAIENAFAFNEFAPGCEFLGQQVPETFVKGEVIAEPAVAGNLEHLTLSGELESPLGANSATVSGTITQEHPSTVLTVEP